ncbi:2'-5' RNA ligase family protein [Pseudonocardia nigra]|uniref:2'-5' RNA ligase family protein n=1 Tax=Pseudonocardia nigra TaxID=1921578 RepID=UPI001C5F970E|nr:2'-5' RNA ligase family protein [Pseudonocardia nigra]
MGLFTALWPPAGAVQALAADTAAVGEPRGWRVRAPDAWHVTLAFHGAADPGVLARRLDRAARGAPAPRLRIAGGGAAPGVRWAGVTAEPADLLIGLVVLAGGAPERFVPRVTVLRVRPRPGPAADPDPPVTWTAHRGPWWRPTELLLVGSEPTRGGSRYRVVHRVPLGGP